MLFEGNKTIESYYAKIACIMSIISARITEVREKLPTTNVGEEKVEEGGVLPALRKQLEVS